MIHSRHVVVEDGEGLRQGRFPGLLMLKEADYIFIIDLKSRQGV